MRKRIGDTVTETIEPKKTVITTVSVKVRREIDLGFIPFMKYVRTLNGKAPGFGFRDASRSTFDIFLSAELGDDKTADQLAAELSEMAHAIADRELRAEYPEAFREAVKAEVPEEAFIIQSTTVARAVEEF
jgi:hypothetical protein